MTRHFLLDYFLWLLFCPHRELAAMATGKMLGGIRPCLKCNVQATSLTGCGGSQAVDVSYVCGGCHKHFTFPEDSEMASFGSEKPPSCSQVQMGGKRYGRPLCPGCFSGLNGLYWDAEAVALVNVDASSDFFTRSSCTKGFTFEHDLCSHQRKHTGGDPETSDISQEGFSQKVLLALGRRDSGERPHVCSACHKRFVCERTLQLHTCKRTSLMVALCKVSEKYVPDKARLKAHTSQRIADDFFCQSCSKRFSSKTALLEHLRNRHGKKPYACNLCTEKFTYRKGLRVHEKTHEKHTELKAHTSQRIADDCFCQSCSKHFSSKRGLREHLRNRHGKKPYACNLCTQTFTYRESLRVHEQTHQKHTELKAHTSRRIADDFFCQSCSKHFSCKPALVRHLRIHTGEKPYTCNFCPRMFAYQETLRLHEKTHSGENLYVCSVCNRHFLTKRSWLAHESKHGSHQCNVCRKAFPAIAELATHMTLHIAEKPYSCSLCLKRFGLKETAVRHEREHTRERSYTCDTCGKSFMYDHTLSLHEKTHAAEKPYKCRVCQRGYMRKDQLLRHEEKHTEQMQSNSVNIPQRA
ncbi:hypothetical protein HPB48_008870 [Haemaphysalis longicornis]|uniref:C2H2-type domain-containing protein n=1 Tax=Haemaphysalis longicornis TaxID=44386 RepID=A0A9J6H208_HAELO|nr:hypothetical protein HPB48_008870 [Haemaphysalis longicornis]